eukprot:2072490-Alexandrium_andersonii.AAC.1
MCRKSAGAAPSRLWVSRAVSGQLLPTEAEPSAPVYGTSSILMESGRPRLRSEQALAKKGCNNM